MDMNEYTLEFLMRCRVAERRAQAERANLIRAARPVSRRLPVVLGDALSRTASMLLAVRGLVW